MTIQETLKEREIEVLRLMADGLSNREIGDQLYIGVETVKWYAKNIYSKLDVSNRKEAAIKAEELGLLSDFSAPASQEDQSTHNLPALATPFLGREREIQHVTSLLMADNRRLVTILASGGMGKTRLSIEAARQIQDDFRDGVYFVPLAALRSADEIVTTIVEVLGFNILSTNITEQLILTLKDRSILLILDNFEHVLEGASLVADIIKATTNIKILVTSRERLNIYGEHVYNLSGMVFPTWETPDDALDYDAVRLFIQSARHNRADFSLRADELDFLARICKLTEGMPLGLELAAGWVDVLSLEQIANEIQSGIDILETDMRDVPERHRSLRGTFEQTWQRLSKTEQLVFMMLSVFRGGFTLESAQSIAGANPRILQKLAQKALIQFVDGDRFAIHELVRQFGAIKLDESGHLLTVKNNHADYFSEFAYQRELDLKNGRQLSALTSIDHDFENIRVSWHHLSDQHQWNLLAKYRYTLWIYCSVRSREQDAIKLFNYPLNILNQLAESDLVNTTRGRLLALSSRFVCLNDYILGDQLAQEAIRLLEGNADALEDLIIAYHASNTVILYSQDRSIGIASAKYNHYLAQQLGDTAWLGLTAVFVVYLSYPKVERDFLDDAWRYYASIGDSLGLWLCCIAEGDARYNGDNPDAYMDILQKGLDYLKPLNSVRHLSKTHRYMGLAQLRHGKLDEAEYHFLVCIRYLWRAGKRFWTPLMRLAQVYTLKGQYDLAVTIIKILNDVPTIQIDANDDRTNAIQEQSRYADVVHHLEQRLQEQHLEHLWTDINKPTISELVHLLIDKP